jgi:tetratricopeptide (TPR) repeat protein
MRTLENITAGLVLAAMLLVCDVAQAKSTSEFLQQGLYAEEVDGDINTAIKTYEKVIGDASAPRNHVAQALYRQGMCYLKTRDEQAAKAVLEKLVNEYADQNEIVQKAIPVLDDLMDFDPAALMPAGTLIYVELGSPGKQVETILNMLKGTPYENPLAAIGGKPAAATGQKSPADIMAALLNPSMMAEFKKIRGCAVGITGIAQNNPPMVLVLYPGKSDALRGMILAVLGAAGQPGQPFEDMNTLNIQNMASAAYDDRVILIAQPAEQLQWCVRQYKGLTSEPTLASTNPSFAKLNKKQRQNNALTAWMDVDEVFSKVLKMFPEGRAPQQVLWANAFVDFAHIDYITVSRAIEPDSFIARYEIAFKEGHQCLAYDLIRTPNISKSALKAVPADAVALVSFALSAKDERQAETLRAQVKNITGLDIGREIFANVEQVILFALPSKQPTPFFPASVGLAVTSHNPQQTRQILTKVLGSTNTMLSGQQADWNDLTAVRYQLGMVKGTPLYCYVQQAGNATMLSFNPEVVQTAVAAAKDGNNVCSAGPLAGSINKLPPSASKLILANAGGVIRLVAPAVIESFGEDDRDTLRNNFNQLALACDKTTIELRSDEQLNNLTVNSKLAGLPPLNQVFGPLNQIGQTVKKAKKQAVADEAKKQIALTVKQTPTPPVIDGNEDNTWSGAEKTKIANSLYSPASSPNDLSASYKVMWDPNNLYLLVDVADDVLKSDSGDYWQDDSVEVFIDADNSKSSQYGENDYQFSFKWAKAAPAVQETRHNRTEGVQVAIAQTDAGYRMEIKFPWSTLGAKPSVRAKIGLDVHVNDDDDGGDRDTKITWHDKQDNAWQNPQLFGNAELAGMLGWWKLDETEGSTAADSSGNGNNGLLQGNPVWRPQGGKIGGAIELDGSGDFVKIDNESAFDIAGQITVSAWVNIKSVPQEWTAIVTKGDTAWRLSTDFAKNVFHFGVSENDKLNGKTSVESNQWHNVVCVDDGSKMSIYVDGNLDVSKPRSGPIGTNDFPVCIGENIERTGRCWNGLIDDVRIYNYALSESEITAIATSR